MRYLSSLRIFNYMCKQCTTASHGVADNCSRRAVLVGAGTLATGFVAGCLGDDGGKTPEPIALGGGKQCDVCGMIIGDHYGPNAEIFYAENSPDGHENPAWFESLTSCMFPYYFTHKDYGWEPLGMFATDYSITDYDITQAEGRTYISSHTELETFADARAMSYVSGSSVQGSMGTEFIPFSAADDATAFADEYGGTVLAFDEITRSDLGG
jgi:copper chaperone NosL